MFQTRKQKNYLIMNHLLLSNLLYRYRIKQVTIIHGLLLEYVSNEIYLKILCLESAMIFYGLYFVFFIFCPLKRILYWSISSFFKYYGVVYYLSYFIYWSRLKLDLNFMQKLQILYLQTINATWQYIIKDWLLIWEIPVLRFVCLDREPYLHLL